MYSEKKCLGWREWISLPKWKIKRIKAKLDTGAKTSALHAEDVEVFKSRGKMKVRFRIFPKQRDKRKSKKIIADLIEHRKVKSSMGAETERPVILTDLQVGDEIWPVEITLVNRDIMGFRMLIGRQALKHRFLIDPGRSFLSRRQPHNLIELL